MDEPRKFQKKPVPIEAMEFTGENAPAISRWIGNNVSAFDDGEGNWTQMMIHSLKGDMVADIGDYIIRDVQGEFYTCDPDSFAESYEETEEGDG